MMNPYLIEIRLVGRIKRDIINLVKCVNSKFEINMHKIVPHITVVGPFRTTNERQLIKDFESVCNKTPLIDYKIDGIDLFSKSGVVYLDVAPNDELEWFRSSLCNLMKEYCKLSFWDCQDPFKFHATIATRVDGIILPQVLQYINSCKPLIYDVPLLRATLLKHGKLLCEYDFKLERMLDRWERVNFMQNRESITSHYEVINEVAKAKPRVFVTSDLQLDDRYVIGQCKRPFSSLDTMNSTLINNWNAEITERDTVYYLGDLCYGKAKEEEVTNILSQLNGKIIFIKGNNDNTEFFRTKALREYETKLNGKKFFMIHDPDCIPDDVLEDPTVWTLHGHKQNRQITKFPFINRANRTINVSVDLTNYRPIAIEEVITAINSAPKPGETELITCMTPKTSLFANSIKEVPENAIVGFDTHY